MNFEHSEDRRMLADSLNRFVSEQFTTEQRNTVAYGAAGHSPQLYAQLADIGAIGALFPESAGGLGGAGFDISLVFECLGRGLLTEPLLGALLVGQGLVLAGNAAQQALLPDIIEGKLLAAFAHDEPGSHYERSNVSTQADKSTNGWVLNGAKGVVSFGEQAQWLLVSARVSGEQFDEQGIALFLVPGDAKGLSWRSYQRFDGGRASELKLDNVPLGEGALLGTTADGFAVLGRIFD